MQRKLSFVEVEIISELLVTLPIYTGGKFEFFFLHSGNLKYCFIFTKGFLKQSELWFPLGIRDSGNICNKIQYYEIRSTFMRYVIVPVVGYN